MEKMLFREEQKFGQWWIWLLILAASASVIIPFSVGIHTQLVTGKPWGDNPLSNTGLIAVAVLSVLVMLVVVWLILKIRLITEIRTDGIWFRYPPLIRRWNCIKKEEIGSFEVRQYRPVVEYGGYGVRQGMTKYGRAYNVAGKTGLQLYLVNGKKILIGTQKKQSIEYAMTKMTGS